jgi:hypothetical protein
VQAVAEECKSLVDLSKSISVQVFQNVFAEIFIYAYQR